MKHERAGGDKAPGLRLDRRDFLKLAGFGLAAAAATGTGCRPGVAEKAIPFLIKPEEVTPGVSAWYATTCGACSAGCGLLAKSRDGRPVKLEGMPSHPISAGGLCPTGQADLLMVYDSRRLAEPLIHGRASRWEEVDRKITGELEALGKRGAAVRILSGTLTSPTTNALLGRFLSRFSNARHVRYDPVSSSAILDAHLRTHGVRVLPRYRFELAEVIAGFDADFLGTWISPVEFTAGYSAGRTLSGGGAPGYSYHFQSESRLTLTGSKADRRLRMPPALLRAAVARLGGLIAAKAAAAGTGDGAPPVLPGGDRPSPKDEGRVSAAGGEEPWAEEIGKLAERLWSARGGKSLVVCGANDLPTQMAVNAINEHLGNYGSTLDIGRPSYQKQGDDAGLADLLEELRSASVGALIIPGGVNPAYDLPSVGGRSFADLLKNVPLVVRIADRFDETAAAAAYVCPEPHALESWNDAEPRAGIVTLTQPLVKPFGNTRTLAECLSAWMGEKKPARELLQREWEQSVFPVAGAGSFQEFWDATVERGYAALPLRSGGRSIASRPSQGGGVPGQKEEPGRAGTTAAPPPASAAPPPGESLGGDLPSSSSFTLVLYPTAAMHDGRHAHNPWLQELPDPVTKIVWDNYCSLSPSAATRLSLSEGDVVRIEAGGTTIELPAHIQPGQDDRVAAVALGYGRQGTDRFASIGPRWLEAQPTVAPGGLVGKNAAPFLFMKDRLLRYEVPGATVTPAGGHAPLARTQEYDTLSDPGYLAGQAAEPRSIIQSTTLGAYRKNPASGSFGKPGKETLWPDEHTYPGHRWGMAIDLNACTGCSACVVSCQAENNIPVVGRDEVGRNREMAWLRIDRYYEEADGDVREAVSQPMMCQQCGNAPCETVCPVLATVHSEEGLNQQIYNRCVGTRYCSNNCPYKIRRFNWFDYERGDAMQRLVLNPDVVVRERGVMEKCSFCVQRIHEAKIAAKSEGLALKDGDVQTACQQSCPARAIAFGDMNDPSSEVARRIRDPRSYQVLGELGVQPSVRYMTVVRNREEGKEGGPKSNG